MYVLWFVLNALSTATIDEKALCGLKPSSSAKLFQGLPKYANFWTCFEPDQYSISGGINFLVIQFFEVALKRKFFANGVKTALLKRLFFA